MTAAAEAVRLAHVRRGSGPPLVLLHALGADAFMWDPVMDRLATERDVLAVDMPGFGGSPPLADGSPASLARAVSEFVAAEGIERPHVAGNSLGGWVALELALAGDAASVTAIAPAGLWPEPLVPRRSPARALARRLLPVLPALLSTRAGRRLALAGTAARPDRIPRAAALRLVRSYATAPGFDDANDAMRAGRFTGLDEIAVPLTFAWPEHDRLVGRPRRLPGGARSVTLAGCGHLPTWDDPEQVARVLLEGSDVQLGR
ncbi:MAG TPA: alpha/beta fold hydrolase [Solirubrobacteraceae bacterium]|nr:alpha/beta fold hydrolase [Solirubrobacteraceae bacterium]